MCYYRIMAYTKRRYDREEPYLREDHRFYRSIQAYKRSVEGDAWSFGYLHFLRGKKQYKKDKLKYRHLLGIPPEGYGRREAKKRLKPFIQAHLDAKNKKEDWSQRTDYAGMWEYIIKRVNEFARRHLLSKKRPMPFRAAFEELFNKRPQRKPTLGGYVYFEDEANPNLLLRGPIMKPPELIASGHEPVVLLDDGVTKAPQAIARFVKYRLRGDNNEVVNKIRISNWRFNSGEWQITSLDSTYTQ